MLYLAPENASSLGEDTFWTWLARVFPGASFEVPARLQPADVLLHYASLGPPRSHGGTRVALCWELYPELLTAGIPGDWAEAAARMHVAAQNCARRVVATSFMARHYAGIGPVDVLPIGVDTDLFAPQDRPAARAAFNLPAGARIGFWCGTAHPMKGYDRLAEYAAAHPEVRWIAVLKRARDLDRLRGRLIPGALHLAGITQGRLVQAMNAADFWLCTSRLRPFYLVEWECMACNLPMVDVTGLQKDFTPGENPRDDVLERYWSRHQAEAIWRDYLQNLAPEVVAADTGAAAADTGAAA